MQGRIETLRFASKLLEGNQLGDPNERDVLVYVPAAYDGQARFPAVMVLPGYPSTHRSLLNYDAWKPTLPERFDRCVADGRSGPALLVMPDAMTRWGGSQYLDSPSTGRYQSYLADEVVAAVDGAFRTIPRREARAVVGTSSGGFGALRLALDRPDVFAAVGSHAGDAAFEVSLRPMFTRAAIALEQAGGPAAFARAVPETGPVAPSDHDVAFLLACAAAYAPDPDGPLPHGRLPFTLATATLIPEVWRGWLAHDPLERLLTTPGALGSMRAIYLDAGSRDEYGLQFAARSLASAMRERGLSVRHEEFDGSHRGLGWRYETSLPWLVSLLDKTDA